MLSPLCHTCSLKQVTNVDCINEIHVQDLATERNLAVLIKELQPIMKQLLLELVGCNKVTIFQEYFSPFYELLMSLFSIKFFMVLAGEDDNRNPCDKDEDSDIELSDDDFIPRLKNYSSDNSDDDSIPPLIFDSSDDSDDDDDDDDSSWPDNSDLSDLPRLASCDESDTESDSEFDVDLNDDDDDDDDDDSYCSGMWLIIA